MRLALLFLFCALQGAAQRADWVIDSLSYKPIDTVEVLADRGYSLEQVRTDSTLIFERKSMLERRETDYYWMRLTVHNPTARAQEILVDAFPNISNEVYAWEPDQQAWQMIRTGFDEPGPLRRPGYVPVYVGAAQTATIYARMDLRELKQWPDLPVVTFASIVKMERYQQVEQPTIWLWLGTLVVVAAFLLYNTYVWILFRDRTYLYYLLMLTGGLLYMTGINRYVSWITDWRVFSLMLHPNGNIYWYDQNSLIMQMGIVIGMFGFVQMTRKYLETADRLRVMDRVLCYGMVVLITMMVVSIGLTVSDVFFMEFYSALYINIAVMVMVLVMLATGFSSYRKGYHPAKYYLMAYGFSLVILFSLAAYFAYYKFFSATVAAVPNLLVVSQTVTFAIALVARVQLLKRELFEHQIAVERANAENNNLRLQLDYNERELASTAMHVYQKNEMLNNLKKQVEQLPRLESEETHSAIRRIQSTIKHNLDLDSDWDKFKLHFEKVHPGFFEKLKQEYPNLTQNEYRLCAYFHMNLTVKEIATMLNIDPESVRKAKTRLNKKINLNEMDRLE